MLKYVNILELMTGDIFVQLSNTQPHTTNEKQKYEKQKKRRPQRIHYILRKRDRVQ